MKRTAKNHFTTALVTLLILGTAALNLSCAKKAGAKIPEKTAPVSFAGCRCSMYGIRPFPSNDEWSKYASKISEQFPESTPAFVWIVGHIEGNSTQKSCILNFPLEKPIEGVCDFPADENEAFLTLCDEKGYQVWLQVEPGDADIVELAYQTMKRYKKHPSVKGFGVDVEWYKCGNTDGYGTPLTDDVAKAIDKAVKKADPRFNYFAKHWDENWMPETYRSDMIFVNDSQGHGSLATMQKGFKAWADHFAPNTVVYQIGYEADSGIWSKMENPVKELGDTLAEGVQENQNCGIIWVDFTLKKAMKKLK